MKNRNVRRAWVLLETVIATGLLVVGLAVLGAQVQGAFTSVRKMERRTRALMLAEQHLAELEMGVIELESADEIEERDFGPRHPDWGWRLTTDPTSIEGMFLQRLDIMYLARDGQYREDDFEHDDAEIVHSLRVMRALPLPFDFATDFGLREDELSELNEKLGKLGIDGLDLSNFDPRFFQNVDFEELMTVLPPLMDAMNMDIEDLLAIIPPEILEQIKESGLLDALEEESGGGNENDNSGPGGGR
jgi:hypothetical protein